MEQNDVDVVVVLVEQQELSSVAVWEDDTRAEITFLKQLFPITRTLGGKNE